MYGLTRWRLVSGEIEHRKQAPLQRVHAAEASDGGESPLALAARVDDQRLPDTGQLFQDAVNAEFFLLAGQLALQQRTEQ